MSSLLQWMQDEIAEKKRKLAEQSDSHGVGRFISAAPPQPGGQRCYVGHMMDHGQS
jgi:hypothetical protein